jgi:hypothetical protein
VVERVALQVRGRLVVLRAAAAVRAAERLVLLGDRGDHVVRAADAGERDLDAGPGGLAGLHEDEAVLVGDDHSPNNKRSTVGCR